jgi:hypothetical protein
VRLSVAQPPDSLDVVRASATCAYARFEGVLLVNWRQQVLLDDVKSLVQCRNQMMKQEFLGAIHMSEPGLPLPDEECRRWARRSIETRPDQRAVIALVIFGDGFGASAVRSVGTAIFAMRSGPPTRIFAQATDAASWLAEEVAGKLDVAKLAGACQQLRGIGAR